MRSIPIAAKAGGFKLQQRAVHVFAEAQRVRDFQTVCNNRELSQDTKLQQLGDIMDASQASCRSDMSANACTPKLGCTHLAPHTHGILVAYCCAILLLVMVDCLDCVAVLSRAIIHRPSSWHQAHECFNAEAGPWKGEL